MFIKRIYPAALLIFSFLFALSMVLGMGQQSSPLVHAQAPSPTSTLDGAGIITTNISPANTGTAAVTSQDGTSVPHTGGGTITTSITGDSPVSSHLIIPSQPQISTSISPSNISSSRVIATAGIDGTPVPHTGGGAITTSINPALNSNSAAIAAVPTFQVSGTCAPDSVGLLTITNTGSDMTTPFTWRVSLNGTPIAQSTFQLNAGQTFNINTSGLYGTLTLDVLDTSNTVVATGSMFCLSPTATPTLTPPSFQVSANCAPNSTGLMTITNTGGDMTTPFTWRVSLNGTPIAQNTFQLSAGQTFNINISGLFGTLTLDVLDTSNTVVATGSMFCLSPTATPTLTPPSFQVNANCAPNSTGLMTITNTGGDMTTPFTWRISLNGIPIAQNTFQLSAGQTFNINTSGLFGTLTLDVLDTSNTVIATGSMFCLSPTATPTLMPPSFQVSAACALNSQGLMTITNTGGDMTIPLTWRISLNGIPIAQNSFQLSAGQSFNINTSGLFGTLTLDVLNTSNTVVATGSMFCPSPTATPTSTSIYTFSPTPTDTPTFTPMPTLTDTPTFTPTLTNTATFTPTPTLTNTATFTPTPILTNTSTFTPTPAIPPRVIFSYPSDNSRLDKGPSSIMIVFNQNVIHDGSDSAANNLTNYLLVENGRNNLFDTTSCQTGRGGDDIAVNISRVKYSSEKEHGHISFVATLKLNPSLPTGEYHLLVCGSTSIENLDGIKLNNGTDTIISFSVARNHHKDKEDKH